MIRPLVAIKKQLINTFSQIDGKVLNILTENRNQSGCGLCHKKQSQFNKNNVKFDILNDFVEFGLSTLHFGINTCRSALKLASQIDIKTHRCSGEDNQDRRDTQAEINAQLLWNEHQIRVTGHGMVVDGIKLFPITLK